MGVEEHPPGSGPTIEGEGATATAGDDLGVPAAARDAVAANGRNRAWDEHKPPELELIEDCVHCGFCLPTCPTYVLWGEEMDSPRGRIVLMKAGLEEGSELSGPIVRHLDNCLGCMACVTACPSGVQYHKLIEDARAQIERNHRRTPKERALRAFFFATFQYPGRLRAAAPLLFAYRRSGLSRALARSGVLNRFPTIRTIEQLSPDAGAKAAVTRIAKVTPAVGERRGRVGFVQGCVQRVFFHDVNDATVNVLAAEGFEVHAPRRPRCCGALGLHAGEEGNSVKLAKQTIEAFESFDHVVANAAGCGSAMKDYEHLLRDEPEWHERALRFSQKVRDVSELLAEVEPRAERRPVGVGKLAYHDACHLAHAQGVRVQPRKLLKGIPGLELVEPREWELCCGSAGIYNMVKPEPAAALGERKARNLIDTGAEAIAAANPGCTLQIVSHLERQGRPMPVYHPMELLWKSIQGGRDGDDSARRT